MTGNEAFRWFLLSHDSFFPFFPCKRLGAPSLLLRTKANSHFLFPFPCLWLMGGGVITPTP